MVDGEKHPFQIEAVNGYVDVGGSLIDPATALATAAAIDRAARQALLQQHAAWQPITI